MAVSGITTFSFSRDSAIQAALRVCQQYGQLEAPTPEDYTNCTQACNVVLTSWANDGIKLWTVSEITIPMVDSVIHYPIGPTGGRITVPASGITGTMTGYDGTSTITFGAAPAGGVTATGSLVVSGGVITGVTMTNEGYGYVTAPSVTLGGAGTGAAVVASVVGVCTSRPVRLVNSPFVRQPSSSLNQNVDTVLQVMARQDYEGLGNKNPGGSIINSVYADFQLTNLELYVFPSPGSTPTTSCHLFVERPIDVMISSSDDFDMPPQAFRALKWCLTDEIAMEYYVKPVHMQAIAIKAEKYYGEMLDASEEWESSTFFQYNAQLAGN